MLGPPWPLRSPHPTPSSTPLNFAFLLLVTNRFTFFLMRLLKVLIRRLTVSKARAALAEMVAAAASSLALGGGRCWSARDWNPLKTKVSRCAPRNFVAPFT